MDQLLYRVVSLHSLKKLSAKLRRDKCHFLPWTTTLFWSEFHTSGRPTTDSPVRYVWFIEAITFIENKFDILGLDVLRLVVAETSVPFQDDVFLSDLLTAIGPCTDKLSKFDIANWTMGLRVLANSFAKGIEQVFKHKDNVSLHNSYKRLHLTKILQYLFLII